MVKNRAMHLLYELGCSENSFKNVTSAIKFYHTIMYAGKMDGTFTDDVYGCTKIKK